MNAAEPFPRRRVTAADRARWRTEHARARHALRARLHETFASLLRVTEEPEEFLRFAPAPGEWSGLSVLEHVTLTDRYLLRLAEKIARKCRARLARGEPWPKAAPRHEVLAQVAHDRRPWRHPEHMTPTGSVSPAAVARRLHDDAAQVAAILDSIPPGAGTLHRIRISVLPEGEDRLDLDQMLDFLGRHAERHLRQIDRNRSAL